LAVVWLGADDNRGTGLYGSTGALRVWASMFAKLPTEPLRVPLDDDPQLVWVDPQSQQQTESTCPGARQLPFARGFEPYEMASCTWDKMRDFFAGDETADREALEAEREAERDAARERRRQRWRNWFRRDDDEYDN
jgi:penicillin-binding protein 1B